MASVAEQVVSELINANATVTTCESCTGGLIASALVDVSGASACFNEGYVTYSNEAKMKNAFVSEETLKKFGAVSSQTAQEMADGIRKQANATYALASTGIAGPTGGTKDKPVGLVYIACSSKEKTLVKKLNLSGDRISVRNQAVLEALKLLLSEVMENK